MRRIDTLPSVITNTLIIGSGIISGQTQKKLSNCFSLLLLSLSIATGCSNQQVSTQAEIEVQNRADAVVSNLLFEEELDDATSYNVHKDGFVVIRFAKSISLMTYTRVVYVLRSSPEIQGVRAEQGGREVCKMTGYR